MKSGYDTIHEDDELLLVNKPSGLLTIPDRYDADKPNLYHLLQAKYDEIYTVHRLDRETSGILAFAKTEAAHRELSRQFQERSVEKRYYALLDGVLPQDSGEIDRPIAPHPSISGKMIASAKGKPSLTDYQVIERFKHYTLVEADIKTGRTHQIRVHFAAIGHPLAVDEMYGRSDAFFLSKIKKDYRIGKGREERPLMSRSSLHAYKLCLKHPSSNTRQCFEAELPKDFRATLQQLQKWGK